MVEEALKKAPKSITLCRRAAEYDIALEEHRVYFGFGGTPTPYTMDSETQELHSAFLKDVEDASRLADALENICFVMNLGGAT